LSLSSVGKPVTDLFRGQSQFAGQFRFRGSTRIRMSQMSAEPFTQSLPRRGGQFGSTVAVSGGGTAGLILSGPIITALLIIPAAIRIIILRIFHGIVTARITSNCIETAGQA